VLKTLSPQTEYGRYQNLTTDSSIVKFQTFQTAADGVDNIEKDLIEGIVPRLPGDQAIRTRDVGGSRGRCYGWLE
jgi:hypothetical protein